MADLDSRSKRASSVNVLKPYAAALVLPDGAIDQGDRQHSAWAYSGILATGAAPVTPPTAGVIVWPVYLKRPEKREENEDELIVLEII